jgi:hypothetical protein
MRRCVLLAALLLSAATAQGQNLDYRGDVTDPAYRETMRYMARNVALYVAHKSEACRGEVEPEQWKWTVTQMRDPTLSPYVRDALADFEQLRKRKGNLVFCAHVAEQVREDQRKPFISPCSVDPKLC